MTFPIKNTEDLFNYIGSLHRVTREGTKEVDTNSEIIEFKLDNKPWINATSTESMDKGQGLFKIVEKVKNDQYPINILFTKEEVFIYDLNTIGIPIYSIDDFLERLLRDHEDLQPLEYRAFNELKKLNYSFENLISDTLRLKEENGHLKHEKQELVNQLSEIQGKLKSAEESIKTEEVNSKGYEKTILDMAKFTIEKNKLLTEKQIISLKKHYNENKWEYIKSCTITFYKSDKIISSSYYETEVHWIEGAGINFRARDKTVVYFDKNGVELPIHENKSEVLFEMPWPALSAIFKIPNPIPNLKDLFMKYYMHDSNS